VVVFGLGFCLGPVAGGFFIQSNPHQQLDWFGAVFMAVGVLGSVAFMAAGFFFTCLGLVALLGRCEVELCHGELVTFDGIGSLGLRRRRSVGKLRRLVVEHYPARYNGQPVETGPLAEMAGIKADFTEGKPFAMAIGYPRSWLTPLAEHLAERCCLSTEPGMVTLPPIEVTQVTVQHPEFVESPEQPPKSKVIVEQSPRGVVLRIPEAGLFGRGGGGCLLWSGVCLCLFMLVPTLALLFGPPGPKDPEKLDPRVAWLILGLFWATGIGFLVGAMYMARRQAVLAVVDDTLMVMQAGLFGWRRWEWTREELSDIVSGPSNMCINDQPVIELHIYPNDGKRVGLLVGRGTDELRWLATVLRRALRLPK
jgi:hypothetical protein